MHFLRENLNIAKLLHDRALHFSKLLTTNYFLLFYLYQRFFIIASYFETNVESNYFILEIG